MTERSALDLQNGNLEEHIKALRRFARALVGNPSDADDLVQETLKRAITYLQDGRKIDNLRSYLLTMLHNVRIDTLRQSARKPEVSDEDVTQGLSQAASQHDSLLFQEVTDCIALLPEEQREVLLLVGLEGMSYKDTAEILGVPIGTIMSRLNRGRTALSAMLEEPEQRGSAVKHEERRGDDPRTALAGKAGAR